MSHRLTPKLLNWFASWTEVSRCWGVYSMEKEQRGYSLCEKKLWRYWSGKYVLTWMNRHAQTSDCYLLLHIFVLPFATVVRVDFNPPPPKPTRPGPKNEQRNEWLKSSTVENRLKRERERDEYLYNYIKNSTTLHVLYSRLFSVLKKHGKRSTELTEELLQPIRRFKFTLKCWGNALLKLKGIVYIRLHPCRL